MPAQSGTTGSTGTNSCAGLGCGFGCCAGTACINNVCVAGAASADGGDPAYDTLVGDPGPLLNGGTTRFGGLEFKVTFDGGARILNVSSGAHVAQTFVYAHGDDRDITGTGDLNLDGVVDYLYRTTFDDAGLYVTTVTTDSDFDGVFDTRDDLSVDVSQGLPYQKTETYSRYQLDDGGIAPADAGAWVVAWSYTGPAEADANPRLLGCDGNSGFPTIPDAGSSSLVQVPDSRIFIIVGTGPGECAPGSTGAGNLLRIMFQQSLEAMADFLPSTNTDQSHLIRSATACRTLYVGCGNSCSGKLASTDLPTSPAAQSGYQRMNINPAEVLSAGAGSDPEEVKEVLIHELIHFAGTDHNPPPAGAPEGHDLVYACGRYGTQCRTNGLTVGWGHKPPLAVEWAWDCADCSDAFHRSGCGTLFNITPASNAQCPAALSCPASAECSTVTARSCFANAATALEGRSLLLPDGASALEGACVQTGGSSDPHSNCQTIPSGDCPVGPAEPIPGADNCEAFPVGWCTGH